MVPAILAAATMSLIHFTLNTGAKVELSYAPAYMSEAQAIRAGVPMASTMWKDFCGPRPDRRCDSAEYYTIDLSLLVAKGLEKETFNSCEGSIVYARRDPHPEARPTNLERSGFYNCHSNADNSETEIVRESMGLPALVEQPRAVPK